MLNSCAICGEPRSAGSESARMRCNVRRFTSEQFELWRCDRCHSLHAAEEVELARYYAGYPIFAGEVDWKLRVVYANMLRRLQRAGVRPDQRVLDYGCGVGLLVRFLRERGFTHAVGYDACAPGWYDARLL
jgi:2-polyprenyl-3-methyl-5-hydroxy-6-metoxy-1,4-benzoquinol methylase